MKHIAAYALLVLGGNTDPAVADVEKVLKEAGVKSENESLEKLVNALKGRAFHELVAAGKSKMSSMGTVVASAAGPATAAPVAVKEEVVVKEEEADVDMGGLFGDDY